MEVTCNFCNQKCTLFYLDSNHNETCVNCHNKKKTIDIQFCVNKLSIIISELKKTLCDMESDFKRKKALLDVNLNALEFCLNELKK